MGASTSKTDTTCEPLRLCKQRKQFMKQATDSRYSLAASHVVYIQSLHNLGIILGKLADESIETEVSNNHMKSVGPGSVTTISKVYVEDVESSPLTMSPPQPPPQPPRFSWDYFDPTDGSFRLMGQARLVALSEPLKQGETGDGSACRVEQQCGLEDHRYLTEETGDGAEVICHRGKGYVFRVKEIESCFIRASKLGNEVSRMLEANQIQISYSESNGGSTGSSSSLLTCFRGGNMLVSHDPQQTTKLVTWRRSASTNSSLLRLPGPQPSDDENENKFTEEFCMIAGSHSSTLDRLYAWEKKLYDEVKVTFDFSGQMSSFESNLLLLVCCLNKQASESIRKEYNKKCDELRHHFAKDRKPHLIDKTRAAAKDLHSRIKVALHTVDSISKRIQKIRDEELQPQLMELIQGLLRMWKSMLECHHAQHTTNHSMNSRTRTWIKNPMIMVELEHEVEHFGSSFSDLVKSYTSYVESLNNWLQSCITQPKERVKGRRAFSPRRAVAPPIFILCRDWSAGIRTLPSQKVSDVIKELLCHIRRLSVEEEMKNKELSLIDNEEEKKINTGWDLSMIDGSLTKVFDRLSGYCEESWKMYEDIKEKGETAGNLYLNYRPPLRPSSTI